MGRKCDVKKSAFLASSHRQDLQVETIAALRRPTKPTPQNRTALVKDQFDNCNRNKRIVAGKFLLCPSRDFINFIAERHSIQNCDIYKF